MGSGDGLAKGQLKGIVGRDGTVLYLDCGYANSLHLSYLCYVPISLRLSHGQGPPGLLAEELLENH